MYMYVAIRFCVLYNLPLFQDEQLIYNSRNPWFGLRFEQASTTGLLLPLNKSLIFKPRAPLEFKFNIVNLHILGQVVFAVKGIEKFIL